MEKRFYLLAALIVSGVLLYAQSDNDIAITINGKAIEKAELERQYKEKALVDEKGKPESVDQFLVSYINLRLNIEEALAQKIDSTSNYMRDYGSYRKQLMRSMLSDDAAEARFVDKISLRFMEEVEVNHAIIPFDRPLEFSQDTIVPYSQAIALRNRIVKEGFSKIQFDNSTKSMGVSLDVEKESGYLGWIRPLMMSPKLERVVYEQELQKISMPIRTNKGYHIIQVLSKRPAVGNVIVEQVMFNFPNIPASKHEQDSVYQVAIKTYDEISLKDNFQDICADFSRIYKTGDKGCLFGEVGLETKIPSTFIRTALELKNIGDVSQPVLTDYAYHILRLKERLPVLTLEEQTKKVKAELKQTALYLDFVAETTQRKLKEHNVVINDAAYTVMSKPTETYKPSDPAFLKSVTNLDDVLLTLGKDKLTYTVRDFMIYLGEMSWIDNQPSEEDNPMLMTRFTPLENYSLSADMLKSHFDGFVNLSLIKYEEGQLQKDATFANTMRNLSDGLLFTEIMEKNVWLKSKIDVDGLKNQFETNKDNYTLDGEYFKGIIVHCKTPEIAKKVKSFVKKNGSNTNALKNNFNKDSIAVHVEQGLWKEGDNAFVDNVIYKKDVKVETRRYFPFYTVIGNAITKPQDYSDVKAEVELDYLNKLEKEWATYLKDKYEVNINTAVINKIK